MCVCCVCCLSDSVGPSGKLAPPLPPPLPNREGAGAREGEREKAEWRGDALRSVSGFMELCTSDPPPWIAIRDRSFSFYPFYCPASSPRSPSSTPPMKVRGLSFSLSVCGHVCLCLYACAPVCVCVCVCACVWAVRHGTRRAQCPCARRWTCSCSPPTTKKKKLRRRQFKRRVKVTPGRC